MKWKTKKYYTNLYIHEYLPDHPSIANFVLPERAWSLKSQIKAGSSPPKAENFRLAHHYISIIKPKTKMNSPHFIIFLIFTQLFICAWWNHRIPRKKKIVQLNKIWPSRHFYRKRKLVLENVIIVSLCWNDASVLSKLCNYLQRKYYRILEIFFLLS